MESLQWFSVWSLWLYMVHFYSLKGFANHSTVRKEKKTGKENCILNWPRNSHRSALKPQRQAQWLKIFLVPFNCKFVKNLRLT